MRRPWPEIDLAAEDRHRAVGVDRDEAVDFARCRASCRARRRRPAAAAPTPAPAKREADDERAAGLQEFAARQRVGARVHARRPSRARASPRAGSRWCVPQRQRLPASASFASSRVAFGLPREQRRAGHHHAGDAIAALRRLLGDERRLQRMRLVRRAQALDRRHLLAGRAATPATRHERTASPSTSTVHAPHWPRPQPNLAPVSPSALRST